MSDAGDVIRRGLMGAFWFGVCAGVLATGVSLCIFFVMLKLMW